MSAPRLTPQPPPTAVRPPHRIPVTLNFKLGKERMEAVRKICYKGGAIVVVCHTAARAAFTRR